MDAGRDDPLERDLVAARAGDDRAFASLYLDVQPRLIRYAASLVGHDAEDVTAEAWLHIARDIRTFDGDLDGFRGWTARIVRNRSVDHLRMLGRRPMAPFDHEAIALLPASRDTETDASDNIGTTQALARISSLPQDQAEAILLRVVVGLTATQAAEVLGKRPGAVRVAAHRGLKTLAKLFEDAPQPVELVDE